MDSIAKALAASERSYLAAKQAVGAPLSDALLARGPAGLSGLVQRADFSKAKIQLQHYRGWVYACVRAIGQKIAGQPIKVARVRQTPSRNGRPRRAGEPEELEQHPILDVLADPNELMVAWSLVFNTVASLELTGRSLWWLPDMLVNGQRRKRAFPIPSSWIVGFEGTTSFERFLIRPPQHIGEPIPLPSDQILYACYPDPSDPHGCKSPLEACGIAVEADEQIQGSQRELFEQGVFPKHAVIVGNARGPDGNTTNRRPKLTGSQRRQLIRAIREVYQGISQQGDPLILDGLIHDIKRLTSTSHEMDWLASGKVTKERILQCFGVNAIILGEVEGANRASALAAEEHFAEFCVNPKIALLSQTLTGWLGPMFAADGEKLKVWIEPVVPSDREYQLSQMTTLAKHGALTKDELRSWANLPPLPPEFQGDQPVGTPSRIEDVLNQNTDRLIARRIGEAMDNRSNEPSEIKIGPIHLEPRIDVDVPETTVTVKAEQGPPGPQGPPGEPSEVNLARARRATIKHDDGTESVVTIDD